MDTNVNPQMNFNKNQGFPVLPPHSNMMVWSILVTIFCCLVGGIISIIYASRANELYSSAAMCQDENLRMHLYQESVRKNSTAKTWIIVSAVSIFVILFLYLVVLGGAIAALD